MYEKLIALANEQNNELAVNVIEFLYGNDFTNKDFEKLVKFFKQV